MSSSSSSLSFTTLEVGVTTTSTLSHRRSVDGSKSVSIREVDEVVYLWKSLAVKWSSEECTTHVTDGYSYTFTSHLTKEEEDVKDLYFEDVDGVSSNVGDRDGTKSVVQVLYLFFDLVFVLSKSCHRKSGTRFTLYHPC